jgi:hypothetical protein
VIEIVDCEEFGSLQIGVDRLMVDGEIALDPRIVDRGYLNVALVKGQVVFRADRYVGFIPINSRIAIRVRPRAKVANIAHMIVKSGVAPNAIPDFSRGYFPKFETGKEAEKIYYAPLIGGVERILEVGLMKSYNAIENPPVWRGRLRVSDTIKRHRARNVRYRTEFDYVTLSYGGVENIALKHTLKIVRNWLAEKDGKNAALLRAELALRRMSSIPDSKFDVASLAREIGRSAAHLPAHYAYYRDPLWTAYLLLQNKLPDLSDQGFLTLDSLIVDLSMVFEAFIRLALSEKFQARGFKIVDGKSKMYPFFVADNTYRVQPDIVILKQGIPVALLDVKYKPEPKESDRYEVLSFMEALAVNKGGFVCPQREGATSRFMGSTSGGKELSLLRFDLAAVDVDTEVNRLAENVDRLLNGIRDYI